MKILAHITYAGSVLHPFHAGSTVTRGSQVRFPRIDSKSHLTHTNCTAAIKYVAVPQHRHTGANAFFHDSNNFA